MGVGPSWVGLVPLWESLESLLPLLYSPPCEDNREKSQPATQKRIVTRTWPCWHPHLGLPTSRAMRNEYVLFIGHLVSGHVVRVAWADSDSPRLFSSFPVAPCCLPLFPVQVRCTTTFSSIPALPSTFTMSYPTLLCTVCTVVNKIETGPALMGLITWCGRLIVNNEHSWICKCKFWNVL